MYSISFYFLLFLIYSILGWIIELIGCTIAAKKLVLNRGFLIGPYCPIYGTAAIIMEVFLTPFLKRPIILFIMATVVATILEYVTSYIMEKLFNARWWDYSNKKFNLNGRVCLENAILFGILGIAVMYFVNPFIKGLLTNMEDISLIILASILLVLFIFDLIISIVIIFQISKNTKLILLKDSTEEISKQVKMFISKNTRFKKRLLNAFPKAYNSKDNSLFDKIRNAFLEYKKENYK